LLGKFGYSNTLVENAIDGACCCLPFLRKLAASSPSQSLSNLEFQERNGVKDFRNTPKPKERPGPPLLLTQAQIDFYADNGYIKLKQVFLARLLQHYRRVVSDWVSVRMLGSVPAARLFVKRLVVIHAHSARAHKFCSGPRQSRREGQLTRLL